MTKEDAHMLLNAGKQSAYLDQQFQTDPTKKARSYELRSVAKGKLTYFKW